MKKILLAIATVLTVGTTSQAAELLSHKAVYDVTVRFTRSGEQSGSGRMEQSWRRSCDGYVLEQQMAFSLQATHGQTMKMESRFNYLESLDGRKYQFDAAQYVNGKAIEVSTGEAIRGSNGIPIVRFNKPARKNQILPKNSWFPTGLSLGLIDRLVAGDTYFSEKIFDGTSQNSLFRVSGLRLKDRHLPGLDKSSPGHDLLKDSKGWPLDVAWYDLNGDKKVDSQPDFRVRMDLYDNGISRNMRFLYPDIEIESRLKSIEAVNDPDC